MLDELWGDTRIENWAHMRGASTRLQEFARQQIPVSFPSRWTTAPDTNRPSSSVGAPRPNYGLILSSPDPRFQADWLPYLNCWETFFEEPGLEEVPADVAREEAFHNCGIDYDQVLLDAWTFRSLYGRESFVTEVTRRRQFQRPDQPNNQPQQTILCPRPLPLAV